MAAHMITQQLSLLLPLLFAYLVRGIAGFGSGLIAVPLLALSLPLPEVVPLVLVLDFAASLMLSKSRAGQADWTEIRVLLPFGMIGAGIGALLLIRMASPTMMLALAGLILVVGLHDLLGFEARQRISRIWALPAGLVGGCAGALFGTSAPPYIIYLSRRLPEKSAMRATFSALFLIDGGFRLALFAGNGLLLKHDMLARITIGSVPMLGGLYLGNRMHLSISDKAMRRLVALILLASGLSLLYRVWR